MATKHKKKKVGAKKGHRRHRVGAGGKFERAALMGLGVIGGAILTPFLVQGVTTALGSGAASIPAWMIPGGGALTGGAIMTFGEKMPIVAGFGAGMLAVGGVMAANEIGLNEPGIAGLASSNNAPPGTRALSNAVGCNKIGGPNAYINTTVGAHKRYRKAMAVGALISE
jgi:hypothetical protein